MKIIVLEKLIEKIEDPNLFSITELLINAVREYPLFELDNTDLYFEEVKKKIGADEITYNLVYDYVLRNPNIGSENNIWVISSFNSFLEALILMDLYKIPFEEVKQKIKELI